MENIVLMRHARESLKGKGGLAIGTFILYSGFNRFSEALGAYLLILLFVILWSLLLIIAGSIAALSYSMVFYY